MKKNLMIKLKNIFMYITLIWSILMIIAYVPILFDNFMYSLLRNSFIGDIISEFLIFVLYSGIWGVPIFYILTIMFMILVRVKYKNNAQNKTFSILTVMLPLILALVMLLTDFNALLQ